MALLCFLGFFLLVICSTHTHTQLTVTVAMTTAGTPATGGKFAPRWL